MRGPLMPSMPPGAGRTLWAMTVSRGLPTASTSRITAARDRSLMAELLFPGAKRDLVIIVGEPDPLAQRGGRPPLTNGGGGRNAAGDRRSCPGFDALEQREERAQLRRPGR